jgi:hypothetical protein
MNQNPGDAARRPLTSTNVVLLIAGLAQIAATFTPAGHVRLLGDKTFIHLPNAGVAFVALGVLTTLVAIGPRGWWRWIPSLASAGLIVVVYARLRWEPTGGFADPLLRHVVSPTWGFIPMGLAIALSLVGSVPLRRTRRDAPAAEPARTTSRAG